MTGFLVPEWYVAEPPSDTDMNIASIIWGFSLSCACFTFVKASRQTWKSWSRTKSVTSYVMMIWAEWTVCLVISIVSWLFLKGFIPVSFWFYFFLLALWVVQIQCILQIIVNRIALLMVNQHSATRIRWIVFLLISAINISVMCIWIPARLQISEQYIAINNVWDRIEKGLIALIDIGLNCYFIHLVHAKLISNGLTKYTRLFHFNLCMIAISLALDLILIGVMSLPNGVIYVQFHPLVYLVKLHIEMNMADLIARVVRAANPQQTGSYPHSHSNRLDGSHKMTAVVTTRNREGNHVAIGDGKEDAFDDLYPKSGIQRTIETQVVREPKVDDDNHSESSSTRALQKHYAIV
ncbi:hypothetical protein BJ170DRAFT_697645 [Xylariales sp. AK1849]|nr:hypothetical protein BJ170DRAFT_697645 [Xylariales sp. AK1849]